MESESLRRQVSPQDSSNGSTNPVHPGELFYLLISRALKTKEGERSEDFKRSSGSILTCENVTLTYFFSPSAVGGSVAQKDNHEPPRGSIQTWQIPLLLLLQTHLRLTSSLQLTVASPWSFMALQEYTPPSKLPGLRISREQIPWTQICLYLGSSPIIIWFFIHWTLGCGGVKKKNHVSFFAN